MLLLPPASPVSRTERRTADRRKADRGKRAAETADARVIEQVAESERVEPEPASGRRWRQGGRRATDKAPETTAASAPKRSNRPFAPLVAQLIATALGLEQTRKRRRGSLEEAMALYRGKPPGPKPRGEA